jgi:hypothetical protein
MVPQVVMAEAEAVLEVKRAQAAQAVTALFTYITRRKNK